MNLKLWMALIFLIGGSAIQAEEAAPERRSYRIEESGADVKLPTPLWNQIQEYGPDKSLTLAPLTIRLREKTKGVLTSPEIEIELPRGGGEVDLSKFVSTGQGTFMVFFDYDEIREKKEEKIFFVSRVRKRRLDNEIWGAGCNKFMDISDFMSQVVSKKGIEVNTTRYRHLSVLGGTFVFANPSQIAQVTFRDTTAPHLFCNSRENSTSEDTTKVSE